MWRSLTYLTFLGPGYSLCELEPAGDEGLCRIKLSEALIHDDLLGPHPNTIYSYFR